MFAFVRVCVVGVPVCPVCPRLSYEELLLHGLGRMEQTRRDWFLRLDWTFFWSSLAVSTSRDQLLLSLSF